MSTSYLTIQIESGDLTGDSLIGTPDLTKFFGDVGEGGFGGVEISPAVIPVAGEKAVNARTQRLHA